VLKLDFGAEPLIFAAQAFELAGIFDERRKQDPRCGE